MPKVGEVRAIGEGVRGATPSSAGSGTNSSPGLKEIVTSLQGIGKNATDLLDGVTKGQPSNVDLNDSSLEQQLQGFAGSVKGLINKLEQLGKNTPGVAAALAKAYRLEELLKRYKAGQDKVVRNKDRKRVRNNEKDEQDPQVPEDELKQSQQPDKPVLSEQNLDEPELDISQPRQRKPHDKQRNHSEALKKDKPAPAETKVTVAESAQADKQSATRKPAAVQNQQTAGKPSPQTTAKAAKTKRLSKPATVRGSVKVPSAQPIELTSQQIAQIQAMGKTRTEYPQQQSPQQRKPAPRIDTSKMEQVVKRDIAAKTKPTPTKLGMQKERKHVLSPTAFNAAIQRNKATVQANAAQQVKIQKAAQGSRVLDRTKQRPGNSVQTANRAGTKANGPGRTPTRRRSGPVTANIGKPTTVKQHANPYSATSLSLAQRRPSARVDSPSKAASSRPMASGRSAGSRPGGRAAGR